jgi:hypothetical protein
LKMFEVLVFRVMKNRCSETRQGCPSHSQARL